MIPGHSYPPEDFRLLEIKDSIRHEVTMLFCSMPAIVGVDRSIVGTIGDRAWLRLKDLFQRRNRINYIKRRKFVLAKRYAPERKEVIDMCNRANAPHEPRRE